MDTEALLAELKAEIKSLHTKLDTYNSSTVKNTADIEWLKKGMFGTTFFTYVGAFVYAKFGGQ
jgi:hypothetical protein